MNENTLQQPEEEKSMGAVLGSIIVIIILLVAAFYLWSNRQEPAAPVEDTGGATADQVLQTQDAQTASLQTQSDSDSLGSIEADLNATNVDNLTPETASIDQELTTQPQ